MEAELDGFLKYNNGKTWKIWKFGLSTENFIVSEDRIWIWRLFDKLYPNEYSDKLFFRVLLYRVR